MQAAAGARLEQRLQFLATDPENLYLLAECADLALGLGRVGEARAHVERALAIAPGDADFKLRLAYLLMLDGRFAEAKEALAPLAAQLPQAVLLLVRAHHHLGELEAAIGLAEAHADAHPNDAEVSAQLAMLYLDTGDFTKARAWSDKALGLKQKTPEAYSTAGFLALGDEDEERAEALLDQAVELNPKSGRAWAGKGLAAMLRGEFPAAEDALRRAAEYLPQHIGTWHALGWCQLLRAKVDEAEASFRRAYDLDRSFGETHGALAVVELLRGAGSRARRRADTALRLRPQSFSGRYAKVLMEAQNEQGRAAGVRAILASQSALRGGTLLDMLARHSARRGAPRRPG